MGLLTVLNHLGSELANVSVSSASCADVLSALNAVKSSGGLTGSDVPVACTMDPVRADTNVIFQNGSSTSNFKSWRLVQIDAPVPNSIDYASLGGIWTFGFASVVTLWWVSKNAGLIVNSIRRF